MRSFVEADQEIGRLHARSRDVPGPSTDPDLEWDLELIERAINGIELPGYAEAPDSKAQAGPSIASLAARPTTPPRT